MSIEQNVYRSLVGLTVAGLLVMLSLLAGCGGDEATPDEVLAEPATEPQPEQKQEKKDDNAQAHADYTAYLHRLFDEIEAEGKPPPKPKTPTAVNAKAQAAGTDATKTDSPDKPKTYRELIIGKWEMSQGGQTITMNFKEDGTIELESEQMAKMNVSFDITYAWDSDDTFTMSMSMTGPNGQSHSQEVSATVKSLDATSMTLVSKHGGHEQEQSYTRVSD